jgi:Ca-activated chloride channel homolog
MKKSIPVLLLTCALFWFAGGITARAQDLFIPILPPDWNVNGLIIEYQRVNVTIENQVATTHIEQLFVNPNDWMLEGIYFFPLPHGASVSQLTMWVDGQAIEAKILEKEEARQIYDAIVRQWRDPALLEYVGTSAIQANVFPIPPHDERRIEIEYQQVLTPDNGLFHFVYPQSSNLYSNLPPANQSIRVEVRSGEAIRAVYSPSHLVDVFRDGSFRAVAGYEADNVRADHDFELYYSVTPEEIGLNLLSYREEGQDGFFLLLVAPTIEIDPDDVIARDLILVIDTSGSMAGPKIQQARDAALYVVEQLNAQDRFNVIAFSTGVRSFAGTLQPATAATQARPFINSLGAAGGTNISHALLEAVNQADRERPTTILFLTDGVATEGITSTPRLLETIRQQAPANVRLFAFGVGDDVDTTLLDSLAQNHGGATTYVRPHQQVDEAVSAFFAKVSTPILANVSLDFGGVIVEQLYPPAMPDLFAGTQLVLTGRYRDGGPATITLHGEVNGRRQTFVYDDNTFRRQGGDDFIARLWATRAIGHFLTQIRLHGENAEWVQSIVNLSIHYGIITPYTSYLIEEDDIFSQSGRENIAGEAMELFAPAGQSSGAAAVDAAARQGEMEAAEAPLSLPTRAVSDNSPVATTAQELVRYAGSKTFLQRDGIWIDTAFDADVNVVRPVEFAGDDYFELLTAAPELAPYLAIGRQLLVVHQGVAYQIVTDDAAPVIPGSERQEAPVLPQATPAPSRQPPAGGRPALPTGLCTAAAFLPLLGLGTILVGKRWQIFRKRRQERRRD